MTKTKTITIPANMERTARLAAFAEDVLALMAKNGLRPSTATHKRGRKPQQTTLGFDTATNGLDVA